MSGSTSSLAKKPRSIASIDKAYSNKESGENEYGSSKPTIVVSRVCAKIRPIYYGYELREKLL